MLKSDFFSLVRSGPSPISVMRQVSHPPALMRYRKNNKILLKAPGIRTKDHGFYDNHLVNIIASFWTSVRKQGFGHKLVGAGYGLED